MTFPIDRVVNVEILNAGDNAVAVNHHEVASVATPSNASPDGPPGINLSANLLKSRLAHNAHKVVRPRERFVEIPRHITGSRNAAVAAIAAPQLSIGHLALC